MRSVLVLVAVGTLLTPTPAHAAVKFDRATMTGFVDRADVRRAFGWDGATLRARAAGVTFRLNHTTIDAYRVVCRRGGDDRTFSMTYDRIFGHTELRSAVESRRKGYQREITGFRISGVIAGISGTALMPPAGGPCPGADAPQDETMVSATLLTSTDREALTAYHGAESRDLLVTSRDSQPLRATPPSTV